VGSKSKPKGGQVTTASVTILEAVLPQAATVAAPPAQPEPPPVVPEPDAPPTPAIADGAAAAAFPTHLDATPNVSPEATPEEKLAALNHLALSGALDQQQFTEMYLQQFEALGATEADAAKQWQALQARLAEQREHDQQLAEQLRKQAGPAETRPWDPTADVSAAADAHRRMRDLYEAARKDMAPGGASPLKDAIVKDLSQRTGLSYAVANGFVKSWAGSSSDSQKPSIALQAAAAEKFGVEPTPFIKKQDESMAKSNPDYATTKERARACVDAMYARTQQWFAERGIKELTLFRGMKKTVGADPTPLKETGKPLEVTAHLNPLNSWSTDYEIAKAFSGGLGYVLTARVPVSRVVGSCFTGVGCLNEKEFVVLGGTGQKVTGAYNEKVNYSKALKGASK
jgi:hypothetical protein